MDAKLSVEVGAKIDGLTSQMTKAAVSVSEMAKSADISVQKTERSFSILNNTKFSFGSNFAKSSSQISEASAKAVSASKDLANQAAITGAKLGGSVANGSNQAAFALTNLGRVAQDAPFGFIGIQNNLNPLLESFQQLKSQTGSTSAALKALGSSLIGPAGLGVALSLITAAITFYVQWQQKSNREAKEAAGANKELADSIKTLSEVQEDGRSKASRDLSQLQSLYSATQNLNIPTKERLKIAEDLIKRYPDYLKGFSAEDILAGKAAASYTKLTNAILAKGYAQAAEENRQKLINKQLNTKVELTKEQSKLDAASAELAKRTTQKQATLDIQGQAALENGINRVSKAVDESKTKINELSKAYSESTGEIKILDDVTQDLIKTFGSSVVIDTEKIKEPVKEVKKVAEEVKGLNQELLKIEANKFAGELEILKIDADVAQGINDAEKAIKDFDAAVSDTSKLATGLESRDKANEKYFERLAEIKQRTIDFNTDLQGIIGGGIASTFAGIGEAIGDSIASGATIFETAGNALLGGFGSFLAEYGKLLIAYGTAAVIKGKLDVAALIPGAGIPAGIAAIAAGVLLSAAGAAINNFASGKNNNSDSGSETRTRSIPGFANGVNNFSGGLAMVGERGPELLRLPTGSDVIPNHKLSGFGGGSNVVLNGNLGISLESLYLALEKTGKKIQRNS